MAKLFGSWEIFRRWLLDECRCEGDERLHVGEIGRESKRDAHSPRALAVDAETEVVDRQMGFVLGLMEARRQFGARDAKRNLTSAWIAEATRSK